MDTRNSKMVDNKTSKTRLSRDQKKEAIFKAATKAMTTQGLDGIHARVIAQHAGVSVGTIYNLYGDLDTLIRQLNAKTYDALFAVVDSALSKAVEAQKPPRYQLLDLAHAYLDFVEHHQRPWLAVLAFNRSQTEPPPKWYLEKEQILFHVIEKALNDFPKARADQQLRHNHARALWASVHGIVTIAVADGFLMQPIEAVWTQIQIIVNAVAQTLE